MFVVLCRDMEYEDPSVIGVYTSLAKAKRFVMTQLKKPAYRYRSFYVFEKKINQACMFQDDDWLVRAARQLSTEKPMWVYDPDIGRIALSPFEKLAYSILEKDPIALDMARDILKI